MTEHPGDFSLLEPDTIFEAAEKHSGLFFDGVLTHYNSYVNRVYGLKDEDDREYVAKFYRPGRWSEKAILEEHEFLADAAAAELPVVSPIQGKSGSTLGSHEGYRFALFPRLRARTFDIYQEEDWIRVGALIGRLHEAGCKKKSVHRVVCAPDGVAAKTIGILRENSLVHPDCEAEFFAVCDHAMKTFPARFEGIPFQRIHGDCHRGNMLETASRELSLIDFDDMMTGPAVQDLWLLLPGHLKDSRREMNLIIEGYEQFRPFDRAWLDLVEPLRFMRQLYFLGWQAAQRGDAGFQERYPGWGSRAFWITETEDLALQLAEAEKT